MKRKTDSFTGTRPIFTGSPSLVMGGFNLDKEKQNFMPGDTIPAGTLAIKDEEKFRLSRLQKFLKLMLRTKRKSLCMLMSSMLRALRLETKYLKLMRSLVRLRLLRQLQKLKRVEQVM